MANTNLNTTNLFEVEETTTNSGKGAGARNLVGTSELTKLAATYVEEMIETINSEPDNWGAAVALSKTDNAAMDSLIKTLVVTDDIKTPFLAVLEPDVLMAMMKSQQSKRSRCKGLSMTLNNYKNILNAALCELLIREELGISKQKSGPRRAAGSVDYANIDVEYFSTHLEELGREIRNIQSKKSIMKKKPDFDEASEAWQRLLDAERILKGLRPGATSAVEIKYVDTTLDYIKEQVGDRELGQLKAAEMRLILDTILNPPTEEEVEEQTAS